MEKLRRENFGIRTVLVALAAMLAAGVSISLVALTAKPGAAEAASLPTGFQESVVIEGLQQPTAVKFAPDGKIFVAEKSGIVKVYDSMLDKEPTVFADLRTNVHNFWDRGLLGMALDPNFPDEPYVYVLYTFDAEIGGKAPKWGRPGVNSDPCPNPPGATSDGCVASGRLSRLTANMSSNEMSGGERGASRGLVPAVPEPLHRHPRFRRGWGALCGQRRRGQL